MGNFSGISLELVGKSDVFVWECVGNAQGLLGNEWGIDQGLLRIIWETVDIRRGCWKMHWEFVGNSYELFGKPLVFIGNPLENLWGLSVRNTIVGIGPNTNRAYPHACNIPYKTALPVPCTHRFYFSLFLLTFQLPFFVSFLGGFLDSF